ncbi:MAG: efflux RND transporter periplasmic adaptor subunit, partial [Thermoguttaceae bacterium]|nr:efflux RND transporter periplasmic adaptor subunit [Thermoguttaceae bacterium]
MFQRTQTQGKGRRRLRSVAPRRRGGALKVVVILLVLGGLAAGGYAFWSNRAQATKKVNVIFATVEKGTFVHEVNGKGSAESAKNVDVASQVVGSATVIYLVPEGQDVKKGQLLVELDSSDIDEKYDSQVVTTNSSRATLNSSRNTLRSAEISLEEYVEGTFKQTWMDYENTIFEAEQNRKQNADSAAYTSRLVTLGYSTEQQYEIDKVAVEKAKNSLEVADLKKTTLLRYTSEKQITSLMSDIETARAKVEADRNSYEINKRREERYKEQSENCKIRAPQDGQVVYANQDSRRMSESEMIKEGATVRNRQVLIRLPDKTQMRVKAMINEANISSVAVGQPAKITFDSIPGRVVSGEVVKVNPYPEIVWMSSAKDYVTMVKINEELPELRSGLTAQVRIIAKEQKDALMVPVQCVLEYDSKKYCLTYNEGVWGCKEVWLGDSNEKQVVIKKGLDEGDSVVSGARLYRDNVAFPEAGTPSIFADDPEYQAETTASKAAEEAKAEAEETAGGPGAAPGMGGGMPGGPGMGGGRPGGMGGGMPGGFQPTPEMIAGFAEKIKSGEIPADMLANLPPQVLAQLPEDVRAQIKGAGGGPGKGGPGGAANETSEIAETIETRLERSAKIAAIQGFFNRSVMEMQHELLGAVKSKVSALQARVARRQSEIVRRQEEIGVLRRLETPDETKIAALIDEIKTLRGDSDADPLERVAYWDSVDWNKYVRENVDASDNSAADITREGLEFLSQNSDELFAQIFPNSSEIAVAPQTTDATAETEESAAVDEAQEAAPSQATVDYSAFIRLFDDWDGDGDGALSPTEFVIGFFSDRKTFQDAEENKASDELFDACDEDADGTVAIDELATKLNARGARGSRGPRPTAAGDAPEAEGAPEAPQLPATLADAKNLNQALALYAASFDFNGDAVVSKEEFATGFAVVNELAGSLFSA